MLSSFGIHNEMFCTEPEILPCESQDRMHRMTAMQRHWSLLVSRYLDISRYLLSTAHWSLSWHPHSRGPVMEPAGDNQCNIYHIDMKYLFSYLDILISANLIDLSRWQVLQYLRSGSGGQCGELCQKAGGTQHFLVWWDDKWTASICEWWVTSRGRNRELQSRIPWARWGWQWEHQHYRSIHWLLLIHLNTGIFGY